MAMPFYHLLFAYERFIITKARSSECKVIKFVMEYYCRVSGKKVNINKSSIKISPYVHRNCKQKISKILGHLSEDRNWLGNPINSKRIQKADFANLLSSVSGKVCNYSSQLL